MMYVLKKCGVKLYVVVVDMVVSFISVNFDDCIVLMV